jgi:hypothetical protein
MSRLSNKVAIVTGASKGIGGGIATALGTAGGRACGRELFLRPGWSRTRRPGDHRLTRRNTRVHFIQPLKERIVREVGYGLSLEGASAADLVKSMSAQNEAVAQKGKVA